MTSNSPLLNIKNLTVSFQIEDNYFKAIDDVSFDISPGEIVGLVGESGSGKTLTGLSIINLLPSPPAKIESGEILFEDNDLLKMEIENLRKIRGKDISFIFQEPMTSLSPLCSIGKQISETLLLHSDEYNKKESWDKAVEWLDKVGIPDAKNRAHCFPYEFSGGMKQRVMIVMALILNPKLIIADEPTTALDVTLQAQIFDLILKMKSKSTSILFITHDMGIVWELADKIIVMKSGKIIEKNNVESLFSDPKKEYTKNLLNSIPRLYDKPSYSKSESLSESKSLIKLNNLKVWFQIRKGIFNKSSSYVKAIDDVSLDIKPNECIGLVGESGSGKTTLGRAILGLEKPYSGEIFFEDKIIYSKSIKTKNIKDIQIIFQDPYSSMNPKLNILDILTEGLVYHNLLNGNNKRDVAANLLNQVGILPDNMERYPHEFSGGQRQRICIARAISLKPKFIVCDESVSALDVTIQSQIIDLLLKLQKELQLSYLFISHDLSVVNKICNRTAVIKKGKIIEIGDTQDIIRKPKHEYTKNLISSIPIPGDNNKRSRI